MLMICPECSGNVSSKASACPHCGFSLKVQLSIPKAEQSSEPRPSKSTPLRKLGYFFIFLGCGILSIGIYNLKIPALERLKDELVQTSEHNERSSENLSAVAEAYGQSYKRASENGDAARYVSDYGNTRSQRERRVWWLCSAGGVLVVTGLVSAIAGGGTAATRG
jgi:hypothetical protein